MLTGKELAKVVNGPGEKTQSMLAAARPYLIGSSSDGSSSSRGSPGCSN